MINEDESEEKGAEAGVPQGSILGPTLYLCIPKTMNTSTATYADDTGTSKTLQHTRKRAMQ
jgi:hypothetical protein